MKTIILGLLLIHYSAYSKTHELYGAAAVNANFIQTNNLEPRYKIRQKENISLAVGLIDLLPVSEKLSLRGGIFLSRKEASVKQDSVSLFEDDFTSTLWYGEILLNLNYHASETFSLHAGLTPHFLIAKSCNNDSAIPLGCGSFGSPNTFVNYANVGITGNLLRQLDLSLNYQKALSDNYKHVQINTLQIMLIHPI